MTGGMAELTEVDVEAMVRDARAGDARALGQLYDTYRDRVARFATGRLRGRGEAEDVTSETFEAVLRTLGSYRAGTDFEAWLFTIAHRRGAHHFPRGDPRRGGALAQAVPGGPRAARVRTPLRAAFRPRGGAAGRGFPGRRRPRRRRPPRGRPGRGRARGGPA